MMLFAGGLIGGACIGALTSHFGGEFNIYWFVGVLSFFLIVETVVLSYVYEQSKKVDGKKMVNVYMLSKVVKILAALVIVLIYALTVKEGLKLFALNFILLYLLFLGIESLLFVRIEKHFKDINKEKIG